MPRVWDSFDPAFLTLCSPDPQAIRPPDEKVNVLMVTLPTNFKVAKFDDEKGNGDPAPAREGDRRGALRSGRRHQDRAAGEAARARFDFRAAGQMVDAARRQLSLRHQGRHAHRAGGGALATSRHRGRSTISCSISASSSAPIPSDLVPFEKYAAAAQSLVRPASAARALQNGAPNIERADKLVQLIAKQKGLSHPAIDAQVALVDARLAANRKKAAA